MRREKKRNIEKERKRKKSLKLINPLLQITNYVYYLKCL